MVSLKVQLMASLEQTTRDSSESTDSVMLIDDDREVVEVIRQAVKMIGFDIHAFSNGEEAIAKYPEVKSQVVIIDLGLRGANGLEVAERLKQLPMGDSASMILISGSVTEKTKLQADVVGFDHVLPKPFAIPKLIQVIKQLFERH